MFEDTKRGIFVCVRGVGMGSMKSSLEKGHTIKWPRGKGQKKTRNGRQNKKQKSKD
jgi:hypothetical protein